MSSTRGQDLRILGTVRSEGGRGAVRIEDRFDTDADDLWSALTEPARLARWIGEVDGDLRVGGGFRAHFFATGWRGTGRVEECSPPQRFLIATTDEDDGATEHTIEVTLTADGGGTLLTVEEQGMPLEHLAAYGAGMQVHVEDLAAHLAGEDRCDAATRWAELLPDYRERAAGVNAAQGSR